MNIYVGNLAQSVTEDALRKLFEGKGEVLSVKLIKDRVTGNFRGFGFVEMPNTDEAQQAIAEFDNFEFNKQVLRVNEARPPEAGDQRRTSGYPSRNTNRSSDSRGRFDSSRSDRY